MFSQTTEYALRAMVCLAQTPGDLVAAPVLARQTGVPSNYLAKVLQQLAISGLITGRRGVGGGYRLARNPSEIRLMDIVDAMGRIRDEGPMPDGDGVPEQALRRLESRMRDATRAATDIFKKTALEQLVIDAERPPIKVSHPASR
jgi:Rrf2 family transcriptional regulator, nitric oxide-sensitive transcriptional repressor